MTNPQTFEFHIDAQGIVSPERGLLAAFVPSMDENPAVVVLSCDPRRNNGQTINELAPAAMAYLLPQLPADSSPLWAVIDGYGRFFEAIPKWSSTQGAFPAVTFERFPSGIGIDAFFKIAGIAGEVAIEMLSAVIETPETSNETPTMSEFLDMVEINGNLPAPGMIFKKVEAAAKEGDAKRIAAAVQLDPVISLSLINSANAACHSGAAKTGSVTQSVVRLGVRFVRRVVFIAEMMSRYQKGRCPDFDYHGYWANAVATGAAMRALMPNHGLPADMADEAFTVGLVYGIGWLAIAETFPGLMSRYIERCLDADPISKAQAQKDIFPCEVWRVSERHLNRYDFPDITREIFSGKTDSNRRWHDCIAQATRVAQGLSPFKCIAVPTTIPVPEACREEWKHWQGFVTAIR